MEEKVQFQGRIEEVIFAAVYLLVSLKRDKDLFKAYSPVYDDAFIAGFEAQSEQVDNLVSPKKLTGEMKVITRLVASDYKKIRNMVNRIDDYLKLSDGQLTMGSVDFGIKEVRRQLNSKNDEGIVKELKMLYKNTENNKLALEPKGYTDAVSNDFKTLIGSLGSNSQAQTLKKDSRIALTKENIKELNKLWTIMTQVMDSGKNIAKEQENDSMLKDYTYLNLKKKLRLERNTTEAPATQPTK